MFSLDMHGLIDPLIDWKSKSGLNAFIEIVNVSNHKKNKSWAVNDILNYSTRNEGNSVITGRFVKTLKVKIYKWIAANDSKSYLCYCKKLVDQYNELFNLSSSSLY